MEDKKISFNGKNILIKIMVLITLIIIAVVASIININIYGINFTILPCILFVILCFYGLRYAELTILSILIIIYFRASIDIYILLIAGELIFIKVLNKKNIIERLFLKNILYWFIIFITIFILNHLGLLYLSIDEKFYILNIIVNVLLNAFIADIIVTYVSVDFIIGENKRYTIKFKDIIFHVICGSIIIPFIFNLLLDLKNIKNNYIITKEFELIIKNQIYIGIELIILALGIIILFNYAKKLLEKDIENIVSIIGDTPNKLKNGGAIQWPESKIQEVDKYIYDIELMLYRLRNSLHESNELNKILKQQAYTDSLTGLKNRLSLNKFIDCIENEVNKTFIVVLVDINKFKSINDNLGHSVGDELLLEVANRLVTLIDSKTNIYRIGGDEFMIIKQGKEDLYNYGKDILNLFKKDFSSKDICCKIDASVGISVYPDDDKDINTVIRYSDIAMYKAKENGYGHFEIFNKNMLIDFEKKRNKI